MKKFFCYKRFIVFLTIELIFIWSHTIRAQISELGVPIIKNYTVNDFKAATGNFAIAQHSNGLLFFGHQYGVLEFNGTSWDLTVIPQNRTNVRSLAFDHNNRVYVGGQGEIGYFEISERGQTYYTSLNDLIPYKHRNFSDVWKIHITANEVVFQAPEAIFILRNNKIATIVSKSIFHSSFFIRRDLYIIDRTEGLLQLQNDSLIKLPLEKKILDYDIIFMLPYAEKDILVGSRKRGLFLLQNDVLKSFDSELNSFFALNKIACGIELTNNMYVIGTQNNGFIILDKQGRFLQHLTKKKGLQSNSILALKEDKQNNLWVTSGIGIDFIEISAPFSYIDGAHSDFGTVYSSVVFNNKLFVGTYSGLYKLDWKSFSQPIDDNGGSSMVEKIDKNVWNLQIFDNKLFISNHAGAFVSTDGDKNLQRLSKEGTWTFIPLKNRPNHLLCGTYNGLQLLEKSSNEWSIKNNIKGFNETSRIIAQDNNDNIWVAHGYKGIFKLRLNKDLDSVENTSFYNARNGFPSSLFINLFKIKGDILFGTEKGVYYYDQAKDSMLIHPFYLKIFGTSDQVRLLKENENGDIWFVVGDEMNDRTGILKLNDDGTFAKELQPFQKIAGKHVPGFENINFFNNNAFIGTKNGLVYYDSKVNKNYQSSFAVAINRIYSTLNDTIIYGNSLPLIYASNHQNSEKKLVLDYRFNSLNFSFSSLFFESPDFTKYSYYLEGYDGYWSAWTPRNQKEYTNLHEGKYIFRVKARNVYGTDSSEANIEFTISPPWYRTIALKFIYFLLLAGALWYLNKLRNKKHQKETEKLKLQQEKELKYRGAENHRMLLEAENELIKIKQEKAESELASKTIHLIQKSEKMIELRNEIQRLLKEFDVIDRKNASALIREINKYIENESNWEEFEFYFNQTHQDFIRRLKEQHPDLTSKDIKICAYIRLNLSSKEIASLINISSRGMDAARLRLRKRFGLSSEQSLSKYILDF